MNVKTNASTTTLYNLIDGTVFRYNGNYYIKTSDYDSCAKTCLCVVLTSGETFFLTDSIVVEYYEAEVILK